MNEVVARGSRAPKKVLFKKILVITAAVVAAVMLIGIISNVSDAAKMLKRHEHSKYCYKYSYRSDFYEDNENGKLKSYKMDCDYTGSAFSVGLSNYFEGGFTFALLLAAVGVASAFIQRSRAKGYDLEVFNEEICVKYSDGKTANIPLCSVFAVDKIGTNELSIVTSEKTYSYKEMEECDAVYAAIVERLPDVGIKGPANNEQVLAKGYPAALKPVLLVLLIVFVLATIITAIACETGAVLLVGFVPCLVVLVLFLIAKTPYIVVTDKRVFYVTDFGRKISLPLNKITVTVTHWWFRQFHIAAPTGRIHLFWLRNTAEIYDVINALLNERQ